MPTGYDLLEHSHEFRMHMLRRLAAGLIDASVVFFPVITVIYLFNLDSKELLAGIFSGLVWFIYSAISEMKTSSSLGKRLLGLVVVSLDGPMTFVKGIIRNVPKIFWYVFLPLDVMVGLAVNEDPRQRWVDKIAKTSIIKK